MKCVKLFCFVCVVFFSPVFAQNQQPWLFHDLTTLIDDVIQFNSSNGLLELKNVIENWPNVVYKTDVSLKLFDELIPVFNLINSLSPDNRSPLLIISLNLVNTTTNRFLLSRSEDVFYPLHHKNTTRQRIWDGLKIMIGMALDVRSNISNMDDFFGEAKYLKDYSFTTAIHNFQEMVFTSPFLPIWFIYSGDVVDARSADSEFFKAQVKMVSQFSCTIHININQQFPATWQNLDTTISSMIERKCFRNWDVVIDDFLERFTILIEVGMDLPPNDSFQHHIFNETLSDLAESLSQSVNFSQFATEYQLGIYRKIPQVFTMRLLEWLNKIRRFYPGIILKNPACNYTSLTNIMKTASNNPPKIMPTFHLPSQKVSNTIEEYNRFNKLAEKFGTILIDERTWITMKSMKFVQEHCIDNRTTRIEYFPVRNWTNSEIAIRFSKGIHTTWNYVKESATKLAFEPTNGPNLKVTKLFFHHTDVIAAPNLQEFIVNAKRKKLEIGCVFSMQTLVDLRNQKHENLQFREGSLSSLKYVVAEKVCGPLFNMTSVLLVDLDGWENQGSDEQVPNIFTDAFLVGEILEKEFPGKRVYFEHKNETILQMLSELHNVSIIVPDTTLGA